ncbi:HNH endonuclease [Symmachiella dynata]|uniref:HNH endonuclease n=1 Tax=Symmachiella dynata TaxID=2527995 RepID=UPI003B8481F0
MYVPTESIGVLEDIWQLHLARLNRVVSLPDEIVEPQRYIEGAVKKISVNSYERNADARIKCIDHYGLDCAVCGFNFGATYGELGEGYIHVHHLRDLASIGEEYEVDPIEDLRPVCPNCHAMLHRPAVTMSIEKLQKTIANDS